MKRKTRQNLVLVSIFLALIAIELTMRLAISPSPNSYGTLFGLELPPYKLIPSAAPSRFERSKQYRDLMIKERRITVGDLWGFHREDSILGYAPKENMISLNGWWQSNNIGARKRQDTAKRKPHGQNRILVFGESYANCSRLPQEEASPNVLESEADNLEVVNFGVDGYRIGQSFLRYRTIKNKIDYDLVLLVFSPTIDLWREINTIRPLKEAWDNYMVMPRFIIERGTLKLVKSPYEEPSLVYQKNGNKLSKELKIHLRNYDRFYFSKDYEVPRFIGELIIYKLFTREYYLLKKRLISDNLRKPDSEAMILSKRIFQAMNEEIKHEGKKFILIFLPSQGDINRIKDDSSFRGDWDKMILSICTDGLNCLDLSEYLIHVPDSQWDKGYDGTHFGPKTNRQIANFIKNHLERFKLL
jgi:hypothetical protein